MPDKEPPTFLKKRKMLWETKDPSAIASYGDQFLKEGHIDDAIDFYERAKASERLEKLIDTAKAEGNLYLYRKICKVLKVQPDNNIVETVSRKAVELGKLSMALSGFEAIGNTAMVEKVKGMMGNKETETKSS